MLLRLHLRRPSRLLSVGIPTFEESIAMAVSASGDRTSQNLSRYRIVEALPMSDLTEYVLLILCFLEEPIGLIHMMCRNPCLNITMVTGY